MFPHLPSTNQLRAFEASARHLSFTKASEELFLTQSAISHQINGLEGMLKQKLFLRQNRRLILTRAGQDFLLTMHKILPILHRSVEKLRDGVSSKKITISTLPSIAATWLVAKLGRFRTAFPDLELMVFASDVPDNFSSDDTIDLAVHFTHPVKGLWQRKMMDEEYLPVCAPMLLENSELPLREPEDLRHHTLIHQDETLGWKGWFLHYAMHDITPGHILSFNHGDLAIQAAIEGQGVALIRRLMGQRSLEQGRLVPLFDMPLPTRRKYFVLMPRENAENAMIMAVVDWLCAEAERDAQTVQDGRRSF